MSIPFLPIILHTLQIRAPLRSTPVTACYPRGEASCRQITSNKALPAQPDQSDSPDRYMPQPYLVTLNTIVVRLVGAAALKSAAIGRRRSTSCPLVYTKMSSPQILLFDFQPTPTTYVATQILPRSVHCKHPFGFHAPPYGPEHFSYTIEPAVRVTRHGKAVESD